MVKGNLAKREAIRVVCYRTHNGEVHYQKVDERSSENTLNEKIQEVLDDAARRGDPVALVSIEEMDEAVFNEHDYASDQFFVSEAGSI